VTQSRPNYSSRCLKHQQPSGSGFAQRLLFKTWPQLMSTAAGKRHRKKSADERKSFGSVNKASTKAYPECRIPVGLYIYRREWREKWTKLRRPQAWILTWSGCASAQERTGASTKVGHPRIIFFKLVLLIYSDYNIANGN